MNNLFKPLILATAVASIWPSLSDPIIEITPEVKEKVEYYQAKVITICQRAEVKKESCEQFFNDQMLSIRQMVLAICGEDQECLDFHIQLELWARWQQAKEVLEKDLIFKSI